MKRGEVYWADLAPRSGSEQRGARPVIVVSHNAFNEVRSWRSVIVVPVSTSTSQARRGPTAVLLELHVTTRPMSTTLFASSVVAVACVAPTGIIEFAARATVTVATGIAVTVITGVAALGADSLVAVIVAVPRLTAVTVTVAPLAVLTELTALIDSTAGLLETQLTVRPANAVPPASWTVAVSCWAWPKCPRARSR